MRQNPDGTRRTFGQDFKQFFGRGLAILLPSVLTLWILWQLALFVYSNVGEPINRSVRLVIIEVTPRVVSDERLPSWFRVSREEIEAARQRPEFRSTARATDDRVRRYVRSEKLRDFWNDHWYLEMTGLLVAIVLIYFVGVFLGGLIGRRIYTRLEKLFSRVPGFKQVYPHVKQVTEMVLGERPIAFNRVVLVQYPRKGIYTVGLVTGSSMRSIRSEVGSDVVSIFVPSTPTPFTGFTITVPKDEVIDLPVKVEEAIRFFITGGVLVPDKEVWDTSGENAPQPLQPPPGIPPGETSPRREPGRADRDEDRD